jgi:peptidoglycan hydrolase CwlO-like protein
MADKNEENIQQLREKLDHTTSKLNQMKQLLSEKVRYIFSNVKSDIWVGYFEYYIG